MRPIICLVALLAACGGGSGEAPYAPSEDLIASHPFLFGDWFGLARSNAGGAPVDAYCRLLSPNPSFPSSGQAPSAGLNAVFAGSGSYTAGGDRIRVHAGAFGGSGESLEFDLRIAPNHLSLTGTYRITLPSGQPRDSGTVELSGPSLSGLVIEDYETPELRLRIVRTER